MTDSALQLLLGTAVSIGFLHTLIGVDHSLPFVAIGKARSWTLSKTLGLTAICGLGHVLGLLLHHELVRRLVRSLPRLALLGCHRHATLLLVLAVHPRRPLVVRWHWP